MASGLGKAFHCLRADSLATVGRLNQWFDDTPMPSAMQYDNDINFKNKIVQGWCECHAVTWVFQLPYRPQSNGVVKGWNGPLTRSKTKFISRKWAKVLPEAI